MRWGPRVLAAVAGAVACWMSVGASPDAASIQMAAAPLPGTRLTGRVIDGASGKPLDAARIELRRQGIQGDQGTAASRRAVPARLAISDKAGTFSLEGIEPGRYALSADASGHLRGVYGQTVATDPGADLIVYAGTQQLSATLRAWMPAALSGTILDDHGAPAVAAKVRLLDRAFDRGHWAAKIRSETRTNDLGNYRFGLLPPGAYFVEVVVTSSTVPKRTIAAIMETFNGGRDASLALAARIEMSGVRRPMGGGQAIGPFFLEFDGAFEPDVMSDARGSVIETNGNTFYPDARVIDEAASVLVTGGEEHSGVDIRLRQVQAGSLSGIVLSSSGPAALVGLRLAAIGQSVGGLDDSVDVVAAAVTDDEGKFAFLGIPYGSYELTTVVPSSQTDSVEFGKLPVVVSRPEMERFEVRTALGARIGGRVVIVSNSGEVGLPTVLENVALTLQPLSGQLPTTIRPARAAADGSFHTAPHPPGRYLLHPELPSGWSMRTLTVNGADVADVSFELGSEDIADTTVTIAHDESSLLCDLSQDPRPQPATVIVVPQDSRTWISTGMSERRLRMASADSSGAVTVRGLPAGQYAAVAIAGSLPAIWDPVVLERIARLGTPVSVSASGTTKVQIRSIVWQ